MKKFRRMLAVMMTVWMFLWMVAGCSDPGASAPGSGGSASPDGSGSGEDRLRVAFIFDTSIKDGGWSESGYKAMTELVEIYDLDYSWQEGVTTADAPDAIRNYANEGYDLIIDTQQYHCEVMAEIAPEYPDTTFACVNGYVSADNMIAITGDMWQHIYLAGVMSGLYTQSNKLGLITFSIDSDSALTYYAAYEAGIKRVNPDAELIHVATGSFTDLAIGKELATSLMDQGCDVIFCNSGDCNVTVMEECANRGVYSIGAVIDHNDVSEDYVLGSAIQEPYDIVNLILNGYIDGSLKGSKEVTVMGIAEGVEEFRVNPALDVDQAALDELETATQEIISGEVTIELP